MDKLTANELRIGNLVTDEFYDSFKTTIKVESINEKGINLLIEDDGNWPEIAQRWIGVEYTFDKLRPIPLTEEWLVRMGFERKGYTSCLGKLCLHHHEHMYPNGRVYYNSWAILEKMPEYVHTLQNLIHALTGKELTIKSN